MSNFDETFRRLFECFGFSDAQISQAIRIASKQDLSRMTDQQVQHHTHITSRKISKWQKYFKDEHREAFKQQFGDALIQLGYEESDQW